MVDVTSVGASRATWQKILDTLRPLVRTRAGRNPAPGVACINSQSVKTAGGGQEVGTDGGKKVRGRKRHIAVDTLGLLLAVVVTAANVDDARAAPRPFAQLPGRDFPRLEVVQADTRYHSPELDRWLRVHHRPYRVVVIRREPGERRFVPLGRGADVRLAGALPALEQGLRALAGVERGGREDSGDPSLPPAPVSQTCAAEPTLPVPRTSAKAGRLAAYGTDS